MPKIIHMASMARCGETLMLRILEAHSKITIAGQLINSPEGNDRLKFFSTYKEKTIAPQHEMVKYLYMSNDDVLLVKQGIWEHAWPFDGFILVRNPLSVYYSLKYYDSIRTRLHETVLHRLGRIQAALSLGGNFERFYRWTVNLDKSLLKQYPKMNFLEVFCTFYNRRMGPLLSLDLPVFHYESIVEKPEENIKMICSAIGLEFEENMLNSHLKYKNVQNGHGKIDLSRAIDSQSNNKAISLSKKERDQILTLTYPTWKNYGYREINGMLEC